MDLTASGSSLFNTFSVTISLLSLLCAGCSAPGPAKPPEPRSLLRAPDGWIEGEFKASYQANNLHEYVNGGAARYLGYAFQELYVVEFENSTLKRTIRSEIYQMDSPANAYGIFSSDRTGDDPGDIGSDAALGDYLLQFWQGPYFVRIQDSDLQGGLRDQLDAFGRLISAAIPFPAGEGRPEMLELLPPEERIDGTLCYFHTLNSLNSLVYQGNENTLCLSDSTEAVTAEYWTDPANRKVCRLIVIRYPDSPAWENVRRMEHSDGLGFPPEARLVGHTIHSQHLVLLFGEADSTWQTRADNYIAQQIKP